MTEHNHRDAVAPRLALVSRNDPLTTYLHAALGKRFAIVADIDVELRGTRRALIGAATVRPSRERWGDRYMKSNLGFRARSRLAARGLDGVDEPWDVVFQTHALFRAPSSPAAAVAVYVDCTYREAMAGWPAWTLLRGHALKRWLDNEQDLYQQAGHLFTFTTRSRASLVDHYGVDPERVTVVGAGVNFRTPPRDMPHRVRGDERKILFVGKDFDRKGGQVLLDAFETVRAEFPDVRLQMVGSGPSGHVPPGVELLGVINDRARMDELYTRAELFCLPSLFDPAPLVVLEAMGHGVPCVLSTGAAAHVRSLVDDGSGGLVTATGDAEDLAAGLRTFLRDPERAQRAGEVARQAMASGYTWDVVVERMAPAIESLARQRLTTSRS